MNILCQTFRRQPMTKIKHKASNQGTEGPGPEQRSIYLTFCNENTPHPSTVCGQISWIAILIAHNMCHEMLDENFVPLRR